MESTKEKDGKNTSFWKRLLLSETLLCKSRSQRIAYLGVMTALIIVANMFFEFKLADTQFSLTLVISALTGMTIGPLFGFVACFLGDLVGFLYHSAGFAYMPWIGISMGLTATISGFCTALPIKGKFGRVIKLLLISVLTFLVCTVAINTTAFWVLYSKCKVPYFTYFITRIFVQGQIWNSLFNYLLLFLAVPAFAKIKLLHIRIE